MPRRKGAAKAVAERRQASILSAIALARRNVRMSVLARDEAEAIRVASRKPWWPRVLAPDRPMREHGNSFWFAVAGEP